jgi:hypothetical protein
VYGVLGVLGAALTEDMAIGLSSNVKKLKAAVGKLMELFGDLSKIFILHQCLTTLTGLSERRCVHPT